MGQRESKISAALESNVQKVIRDGIRLSYGKQMVVLGKDTTKKRVLLGGLGALGVGLAWNDEEPYHKDVVGYVGAPEMTERP